MLFKSEMGLVDTSNGFMWFKSGPVDVSKSSNVIIFIRFHFS